MSPHESTSTTAGASQRTNDNAGNRGNTVCDSNVTYSRRTLRQKRHSLCDLSQQLEEGVVAKEWMLSILDEKSNNKKSRMTYLDMKKIIERRLAYQKKGFLSEQEVQDSVKEFQDLRNEEELDAAIVKEEVERFNRKMMQYNNDPVGNMSSSKEEGRLRFLFCQTNNMSSKLVRQVKIQGLKYLERVYDTDATFLNEHGCNMKFAPKGCTLQKWMGDEGTSRSVMAHNSNDDEYARTMHQPGGTAIRVTGKLSQYWRKSDKDFRNLGRWCSVVLYANPNQRCRIVSMYNVCKTRPRGLRTQYQQINRYIQNNCVVDKDGRYYEPRDLFVHDFVRQCKRWIKNKEEVFVMGDINDDAIMGELCVKLAKEGIEISEVSSTFWSDSPPASHINGKDCIVMVAKSKGLEVIQLLILPHFCSVGDHRSWVVELTTRSVLGPCRLRI